MSENSIEKLFFQGKFPQITKQQKKMKVSDLPYLVGALSFTGQIVEARQVMKQSQNKDVLGSFFLGLGLTRASEYEMARRQFLRVFKNRSSPFDNYLLCQGMAFYNFFTCRFVLAEKWLLRAQKNLPTHFKNSFWDLILKDLTFYVLLHRGQLNTGKENAIQALKIAKKINNSFTVEAIQVALVIYESNYGTNQSQSLLDLERFISIYKNKSTFYYCQLNFEYIRRLNLLGNFRKSELQLESLKDIVFKGAIKRHKALWSFRKAHLLYLQGYSEQCLATLNSADDFLEEKKDLLLQIQILGLQYKIAKKSKGKNLEIETRLKKMIFRSKDAQSLSYAYRFGWNDKPLNEDPYVHFFHQWQRNGYQNLNSLNKIVKQGWLSLFVDLLPLNHQQFIYLDFLPKQAILFNENEIVVLKGLTQLIRQCLLALNRSEISKKEFVELIWGYEYEAYRHDQLIYTIIGRVREFLQNSGSDLILQDHKIIFRNSKTRVFEHEIAVDKNDDEQIRTAKVLQLNHRQIEMIEFAQKNKYFSIEQIMREYSTSRMTAFRDLKGLVDSGQLYRTGIGRATRYSLSIKTQGI